ncbi:MAG: cupin domain-containing protein [Gammaproteobacteria bacterium]|nr:cupin domain-containing protein [Gammaproteobacteria bacterium]
MPIIDHADSPQLEMRPGITGRFLANKALGSTAVSLLVNTVEPGAEAPLHTHTVEETMLVLEGSVWAQVGAERFHVGPNHTVVIPPHTAHAWGNSGSEVAKLLWAFAGADPFADATYLEGTAPKHQVED